MKLLKLEKVRDGKYLKNYELTYLNRAGKEKKYEIVSRNELADKEALGVKNSGMSIVAIKDGKLLLLREFRMGVNRTIINLCAGMMEEGETLEQCAMRELKEESGLLVKRIIKILPPSYSAVGISDVKTAIVVVEAEGELSTEFTSVNEEIRPRFYSKEECLQLIGKEEFSSRSQLIAYTFAMGAFD